MPSQPAPWKAYRKAFAPLKYGDALWEPGPIYSYRRVQLGDVGYTRRGRFHFLFSAGIPLGSREPGVDVPFTFEPLDVGPIIAGEVRPPGYVCTSTIKQIGADVGGSSVVACSVGPGVKMSFELTSKQGAALITNYPTHREDIEREIKFENYTKRHYESWVDFAREQEHGGDIRPILVTGVHLTRQFAMIAYADNQTRMECEFSVGAPSVSSASLSVWGSWQTQGLVHTNCGPHSIPTQGGQSTTQGFVQGSAIPEEHNQCIFIRYYTMRKKIFIPRLLKAGAGPHQLPDGDTGNDGTEEVEVGSSDSDDELVEVGCAESGLNVTHNVPLDDRDDFDVVAEFIFQRSNATSVLLHHRDIQEFTLGSEEESIRHMEESAVVDRVEIDENGVARMVGSRERDLPDLAQQDSDMIHNANAPVQKCSAGTESAAPITMYRPPNPGSHSSTVADTQWQTHQYGSPSKSALDAAIEELNLAGDISSITPAQAAFGSVSALLTSIRDSMSNELDYTDLGLSYANVCGALGRGINGRQVDELSPSVLGAIEQLTTTAAEIQRKIVRLGKRNAVSRSLDREGEKEMITAWMQNLIRIFHVFNTELAIDSHVVATDIHRTVSISEDSASDQESASSLYSTQAMSLVSTFLSSFSTLPGKFPHSTRTSHGSAPAHLHRTPQSTQSTSSQSMHTMAPAKTPRRSSSIHLSRISKNKVSPREAQHVLTDAVASDDYLESMENLTGWKMDPQGYIDGMDRLIDTLEPGSEIYDRSLRALRRTCGIYGFLPTSRLISERLSLVADGKMKRPFASGGSSDLWKARNDGGQIFSIKQLRTYEVDDPQHVKKKYCKEVVICSRIRHANILSIEGFTHKDVLSIEDVEHGLSEFCLVSKWMDNGNALQYVKTCPHVNRTDLLLGITRGLHHLHSNGVIHGDLKGSNILIDEQGNPLLADFGLSSITKNQTSINTTTPQNGGTIRWAAPELLGALSGKGRRKSSTAKSDIYSLSMVVIELYTGNIPFFDRPDPAVIVMVTRGERPSKPATAEVFGLTPELWELTRRCWHEKPERRPDALKVLTRLEKRDVASPPSLLKRLKEISRS